MGKDKEIIERLIGVEAKLDTIISFLLLPEGSPGHRGEDPAQCQHPKEARIDMRTMGWERWQCGECGYLYEAKTKEEKPS